MAVRGLKLIKNGQVTILPYNKQTIALYEERNRHIKKSRNADKEHVTITDATEEEVREFLMPAANMQTKKHSTYPEPAPAVQENKRLQDENAALLERMARLEEAMLALSKQKETEEEEDTDFQNFEDEEPNSERKKPGPKPKK